MKDTHFDTLVNYNVYKWKSGMFSDEELIKEMEREIFQVKDKGEGLKGIIYIAIGEK